MLEKGRASLVDLPYKVEPSQRIYAKAVLLKQKYLWHAYQGATSESQ